MEHRYYLDQDDGAFEIEADEYGTEVYTSEIECTRRPNGRFDCDLGFVDEMEIEDNGNYVYEGGTLKAEDVSMTFVSNSADTMTVDITDDGLTAELHAPDANVQLNPDGEVVATNW